MRAFNRELYTGTDYSKYYVYVYGAWPPRGIRGGDCIGHGSIGRHARCGEQSERAKLDGGVR